MESSAPRKSASRYSNISTADNPVPSTSSGITHERPWAESDEGISKRRKKRHPLEDDEIRDFLMRGTSESELESESGSDVEASEQEGVCEQEEESDEEIDDSPTIATIPIGQEILWFADPQAFPDIPFSASAGLKIAPLGNDVMDYFSLMFTDELYDLILKETNFYGSTLFSASSNLKSRSKPWRDVSKEEFLTFLGIILHMGNVKLSKIQNYWRLDDLYDQPIFRRQMSRDRFLIILRSLHFGRNPGESEEAPSDPLYKVRPLLKVFKKNIEKTYYPAKNLCLDESLVMWRGRLYFRQYIKSKKHKYGIKLYLLCEPNGFVVDHIVYTGARDVDVGGRGHTEKVVKQLLKNHLNVGHAIFMDNFYNSVVLTHDLLKSKTLVTGTLSLARKNNPPGLISAKIKKGEVISMYSKDGVCVMKWKDKREVSGISSEYDANIIETTNVRGNTLKKPKLIVEYNKNMGGVDKSDQMLAYYYVERRTLRWYVRLALHFFQIMVNNSFILYKKYSGRNTNLDKFREEVIRKILYKGEAPSISVVKPKRVYIHLPSQIKHEEDVRGKRVKRKKCKVCSSKGIRKDVIFYCATCEEKPGLCLEPCFREHHKY